LFSSTDVIPGTSALRPENQGDDVRTRNLAGRACQARVNGQRHDY
jgi:hypothetical protein